MKQLQEILEGLFNDNIGDLTVSAWTPLLIRMGDLTVKYGKWDEGAVTPKESKLIKDELLDLLKNAETATTKPVDARRMIRYGKGIVCGFKSDEDGWEINIYIPKGFLGDFCFNNFKISCYPKSQRFTVVRAGSPEDVPYITVRLERWAKLMNVSIKDHDVWKALDVSEFKRLLPTELTNFITRR